MDFFVGEEQVFLIAFSDDDMVFDTLSVSPAELNDYVRAFRDALSSGKMDAANDQTIYQLARQGYDWLFFRRSGLMLGAFT